MRRLLFLKLLLCVIALKDAPASPNLDGKRCEYGVIRQEDDRVWLQDHNWIGAGHWCEDDTLDIWWSRHGTDRCFGTYRIEGKKLVGKWCHADDVEREYPHTMFLE
jgi:hypothetical protein